jgi:hypothetical protein
MATRWHISQAMTEKQDQNQPKNSPQPKALAHLEAKRAQNLRDNLLKRKAQARARKDTETAKS